MSGPASTVAGTPFSFTVTAVDQAGAIVPGYSGTVHFTSTDLLATLPANSTLTGGVGTFAATMLSASSQSLVATDTVTASITGTAPVPVVAKAATLFGITTPGAATAGSVFPFTVTARDQYGNTDTAYTGTVHFASTDSLAALPADSTLSVGTGTFSATLKTSGSPIITATDTGNASITGGALVTVGAGKAATFALTAPATANAGTSFAFTVAAKDQFGNIATGYAGTVHFTSSDTGAVLPADSTLATGTGSFSATLAATGSQTITATDTVTQSITGTSAAVLVTPLNAITQAILVATPSTMGADGVSTSTITAKAFDAQGNPAPATSNIVITLGDSNAVNCSLTGASTTIPAGSTDSSTLPGQVTATSTTGSCSITGTATGGYTGPVTAVTITTSALGGIQLPAEVLVQPGGTVTFIVTLTTAAPAGGAVVTLGTSNPGVATVTPSIAVPVGTTSGTAQLTGVSAGQTTITASSGNYTPTSTVGTVKIVNAGFADAGGVAIGSVSLPATWSRTARVTLSAAAPQGGLVIQLTSLTPAFATVDGAATSSVLVPAGQLISGPFTVAGVAQGNTSITAANPSVTSGSLPVYVAAPPTVSMNGNGKWLGNQMHNTLQIYLSDPAPAPLTVSIGGNDTTVATSRHQSRQRDGDPVRPGEDSGLWPGKTYGCRRRRPRWNPSH